MSLGITRWFQPPSRIQLFSRYGVLVRVVPGDQTVPIEVERALDSGGTPGTYAPLATVGPFPKAGDFFLDPRPNDGSSWWYRARHAAGTKYSNAGAYSTIAAAVTARQLSLDDTISQIDSSSPYSRTEDIRDLAVSTPKIAGTAVTTAKIFAEAVTPTEGQSRRRCKVYQSAPQSVATATPTGLQFDLEYFDTATLHDTASNNTRITIPSGGTSGGWIFTGYVLFASNATGVRTAQILKNNATQIARVRLPPSSGDVTEVTITGVDNAPSVGDYYEFVVTQTSGGNLNIQGEFAGYHAW